MSPTPADLLGAVMLLALAAYALLGGADFGGGIWDLLASGPRRAGQRGAIERAIGPIWEANHVWLILVVVVLFTGFPAAFGAISTALFGPLVLLLVGIVLRGASFTFRTYEEPGGRAQDRWSLLFSTSSVLAPAMLGVVVGALASGRLRLGGGTSTAWSAFTALSPFSVATAALTCTVFAFLAAVYLSVETEGALREDFRRRAVGAGFALFVAAAATAALSWRDAPVVFHGLTSRAWSAPLHVATGACALTVFGALKLRRFRLARVAAGLQVSLIVLGWGASQYPYLVVPEMTLSSASAPWRTQAYLLVALAAGVWTLFPSLYLLFRVFKGERPFALLDRTAKRERSL